MFMWNLFLYARNNYIMDLNKCLILPLLKRVDTEFNSMLEFPPFLLQIHSSHLPALLHLVVDLQQGAAALQRRMMTMTKYKKVFCSSKIKEQ